MIAVLGTREADVVLLKNLTKASNGAPYINDDLSLKNLSFLWRHAWLSKTLKLKAEDWGTFLKLRHQDLASFATPKAAWEFVEAVDQLNACGLTPDL